MKIFETKDHFQVDFPARPKMISIFKAHFHSIERGYDAVNKVYTVSLDCRQRIQDFAIKYGFKFEDKDMQRQQFNEIPELPNLDFDEKQYLNLPLYEYQRQGVAHNLVEKFPLIGDDMGVGKTWQAIATAVITKSYPVLVICPSSLKLNWKKEFKVLAGIESAVLTPEIKRTWPNFWRVMNVPVFICNYESLRSFFVSKMPATDRYRAADIEFTENIKLFKSIIIDEAHNLKDWTSQRSKITMGICAANENIRIMQLSGTFIVNSPKDLVVPLSISRKLSPVFGGFDGFMKRYCEGGKASNLGELRFKLRTNGYYCRMKSEVLSQLPEKSYQQIPCEITTRKEYESAEQNLRKYLIEAGKSEEQAMKSMDGHAMVLFGTLKRIAALGKLEAAKEIIENVTSSGHKIIVSCWHIDIAKSVLSAFPHFARILGEDDIYRKETEKERFQSDPGCTGIVVTVRAGGVGHTLTAADHVLHLEQGWNPKDRDQMNDRACRIGQKNNVNCITLVGQDTVDEEIYDLIEEKAKMVAQVQGGGDDIDSSILKDLIKIYKS